MLDFSSIKWLLLTIVMWMLMILVQMRLLCSVILTNLTAVVNFPAKMESGTFPMELELVFKVRLKMNFTEIEEHKLYVSIIEKVHSQKRTLPM